MSKTLRKILCFESSCDDMSVALLECESANERPRVLSWSVQSQDEVHKKYGGVVPELAARAHLENLLPCLKKVLFESQVHLDQVDAFAATSHPGLIGSLLIGQSAAKTLSFIFDRPFISCDHLEAHLHSIELEFEPQFPLLVLLASGGHTSLFRMDSWGLCTRLADTRDDAIGEAFDKGAKLLGLGFPGGAALERLAQSGRSDRFEFSVVKVEGVSFSFSGLKSQLARWANRLNAQDDRADLAASYQSALFDHLLAKTKKLVAETKIRRLALVGGVARNQVLRQRLNDLVEAGHLESWIAPSIHWCTDNAAMVGALAFQKFWAKEFSTLETDVASTERVPVENYRKRAS